MGNNANGTNTQHSQKTKFQDYQFVVQVTDAKRIMRNKATQKLSVVIERTFGCQQLLNEYVKQSKKSLTLSHQFYVNAFDHQMLSLTNLCSKQFKIVEYFQHHPQTLMDEINNRSQTGKYFTQKQVMSILCSCVLAMSHLSKLQLVHYTLNPSDIVIDDEGICKVLCSALSQNLFDFNYKKDFYYAPQTLKIFKLQSAPNGLTNKSGVFTLGMTLLQMIFLTPLTHLYNNSTFCLDFQELNNFLQKVKSVDLREVLKKMLKYHSYDRITFTQLQEMLFEVISRAEQSGQASHTHFQYEANQSQKLEESIVRLQSEPNGTQNARMSIQIHKKESCVGYRENLQTLAIDEEDQPNLQALVSLQDEIVLDQCDKGTQQDYYLGRRSTVSSYSDANFNKMSNYSAINPRILTEQSNFSNLKDYQANFVSKRQLDDDLFHQKENCIPNFTVKRDSPFDDQNYPRYVVEDLKEGRYEGYKLSKYRHGFGTFYYKQGGKYCGEWDKNRMHGKGVLYYSSGKIAYEGDWKEDMLHGYGVLYNENIEVLNEDFDFSHLQELGDEWIKYQGYFQNDVKCGQGTLFLSNGESFRGMFQNDQPNGQGNFRNVRGDITRGFWLMGALNSTS